MQTKPWSLLLLNISHNCKRLLIYLIKAWNQQHGEKLPFSGLSQYNFLE